MAPIGKQASARSLDYLNNEGGQEIVPMSHYQKMTRKPILKGRIKTMALLVWGLPMSVSRALLPRKWGLS